MKNQYTRVLEMLQDTTDHSVRDFAYLEGSVDASGIEDPNGKAIKFGYEVRPRVLQLKCKLQRIQDELNKIAK